MKHKPFFLALAFHVCWCSLAYAQQTTEMVDIGGRKLEVVRAGSGSPTVVLEAPATFTHDVWRLVLPHIAAHTSVVAYSRAGIGGSDPTDQALSIQQKVADLHVLLDSLNINGPIVLAGNSLGGLLSRTYARMHPEEVAGLVLIDGTHERQYLEMDRVVEDFWSFIDEITKDISSASVGKQQEWRAWLEVARTGELPVSGDLPDVPMAVLTALKPEEGNLTETEEGRIIWRSLHDEWFEKTTEGLRIVTSRSGHVMELHEPMMVVESIRWVVDRARSGAH